MEQSSSSARSSSSSQRGARELQGPRPAPLKVRKDSHKIRKPPPPPVQARQPVIIYTVSPKVVHADPSEFMSVVQRLTGARAPASASSSSSVPALPEATHQPSPPFPFYGHHVASSSALLPPPAPHPQLHFPFQLQQQGLHELIQLSPAARLAAIEQASARSGGGGDVRGLPPLPSILSPVPGSLPAIPASFFSPPAGAGVAGGGINLFGELISPAFLGATTSSGITAAGASPNYPVLQQLPSASGAYYWDLFNNHQNL
ncbi:protein MKS1-like [Phragmites australis]|uniref:protein MKS1-like n=1 Tax=Phragmites australis TaxID=29695 RepID=UPI002D76999D|nr:protein MKS1-like [Phragmites australis]